MAAPIYTPAAPENISSRRGTLIDTVVIHVPQSNLASMTAWFKDPDAQASAHYGIGINREVLQYVHDEQNAWHAGNGDVNRRSIGIEVEGILGDPIPDFLPPQMETLVALCHDLITKYRIPIQRGVPGFIGHVEVPCPLADCPRKWGGAHHHVDPGPMFPWDDFMQKLKVSVPLI